MYPFVILAYQSAHDGIDREFVTSGVYAQLKSFGESEFFYCIVNDQKILAELFFEPGDVADILNTFVEPSGKLGGYGLGGYSFLRQGAKYEEYLDRSLRGIDLIHRNLSHEIVRSLAVGNVTVNPASLLYCKEIFSCNGFNQRTVHPERFRNARNHKVTGIFEILFSELHD